MEASAFSLIITIVNKGYADTVMSAARAEGARGGTIVHARGTSSAEAEKIFGFKIEPEKEMVLILTETASRPAIMKAVYKEAGLSTAGEGITISLPVDEIMGTNLKNDGGEGLDAEALHQTSAEDKAPGKDNAR